MQSDIFAEDVIQLYPTITKDKKTKNIKLFCRFVVSFLLLLIFFNSSKCMQNNILVNIQNQANVDKRQYFLREVILFG